MIEPDQELTFIKCHLYNSYSMHMKAEVTGMSVLCVMKKHTV